MKKTFCRVAAMLLSLVMMITALYVSPIGATATAATTAPMLAYVPLDNRPVVYQRVQMAAGAAGFDIRVPSESLFTTKLDGQGGTGINGSQHGDGAAIMDWLDEQEAAGCNYYIIHLDQMLSGGLVGSRHPDSQTVTQEEADIINRLLALANKSENRIYFIDIVMRLASTGSYKGYESAQYSALRAWGAENRYIIDDAAFSTRDYNTSVDLINQIHSKYRYDPDGNTIAYDTSALTEANVNEYLAFRKRKLTLMNMMIQELKPGTPYLVGVDDSTPNKNIQWNELMFLDARANAMGLDYVRMSDTDSIGLMALARCANDMYGVRPRVRVRYYGNGADKTDDYGNDTLRQNVDSHIACLNAVSVSSDAEVEVLVLTQPDSSYSDSSYKTAIDNLVSKAQSNITNHIPTIVIEVSEQYIKAWGNDSKNLQDELLDKVDIGRLMGYSNWNTVGNSIGIALGIGVSRYTYIKYDEAPTEASHNWHLQSLTYAYVKDISYNARNKINTWEKKADNGIKYWLEETKGWNANNHYADIVAYKGSISAGRAYINEKLESYMRGTANGSYNGNANQIESLLEGDDMYTSLNRTVQTADIGTITLSNFYFPWDRLFEIYFSVSGDFSGYNTYYLKDSSLLRRVPTVQNGSTFTAHSKEQFGASTVTVKNLSGTTIGNADYVGTGYSVKFNNDSKTYAAVVTADVSGDGKITTTDVYQTMNRVLGAISFSAAQDAAAEVNEDGKISSTDARQMLQLALKQP